MKLSFLNFGLKNKNFRNRKGFTLAEMLIAFVILALILTYSGTLFVNYYNSLRNLKATNLLYQEGRFLMERIINEVRNNTVDYEEYFDKSSELFGSPHSYANDYCKYSSMFFSVGSDGLPGTTDDKNIGEKSGIDDTEALDDVIQNELYLIDSSGVGRTFIRKVNKLDDEGNMIGRAMMVKLIGKDYGQDHIRDTKDDGEKDSFIDTWICADAFSCECGPEDNPVFPCESENIEPDGSDIHRISEKSWLPITPSNVDVASLQFFIAPKDDPRKGFNMDKIQIHPHITIKLTLKAGKKMAHAFRSRNLPNITLESTVSSRVFNEVAVRCALKECDSGDGVPVTKECPRGIGICAGAIQTCTDNKWPGCGESTYETYAGDDYEHLKEVNCYDNLDNDCDGYADEFDQDCIFWLCSNGIQDVDFASFDYEFKDDLTSAPVPPSDDPTNQDEKCLDVGGLCSAFHSYEDTETNCNDDLDNDCDTLADEFDPDCINIICINDVQDTGFVCENYSSKNDLRGAPVCGVSPQNQDELGVDIGGLCGAPPSTELNCFDGLDNDADNVADELDSDCKLLICGNGEHDCDLVPSTYGSGNGEDPSFLKPYKDLGCKNNNLDVTDNDEECIDVGGICENKQSAETICDDGLDNDCNGDIDADDENCCVDGDNDGFCSNKDPLDCDDSVYLDDNICCIDEDNDDYGAGAPGDIVNCPNNETTDVDCKPIDPEINPGKMEICDDNKDNDCDGNKDTTDAFCIYGNSYEILDNLTSTDYRHSDTINIEIWTGNGKITVPDTNSHLVVSEAYPIRTDCGSIASMTLIDDGFSGATLNFELSDGIAWKPFYPGDSKSFGNGGNQILWKATLQGNPKITKIRIEYTCS